MNDTSGNEIGAAITITGVVIDTSGNEIMELGRAVYYMDMADQVLKAKQILQMRKFEQKLLVAYKVYVNKFEK
nr:hypothetical protein [Candidatus Sigynarchaeota archaeon]